MGARTWGKRTESDPIRPGDSLGAGEEAEEDAGGKYSADEAADRRWDNSGNQLERVTPGPEQAALGRLQAFCRGVLGDLLCLEKSFSTHVVYLCAPVIEAAEEGHEPFGLAELGIVSHHLAAHRDETVNQPEFDNLLERVVPSIKESEINLESGRLLRQPLGNDLLGKAEERGEPA
jgi:hypothetical protein